MKLVCLGYIDDKLMSRHPGVRARPLEIRPAPHLQALIEASAHRRSAGIGE
jgi:hypothetical protein